jgi:hypothetical protein
MINKYDENDQNLNKVDRMTAQNPNMSQDAFMAMIEQDANERYMRRKENEKEAEKIRLEGNVQFKLNNYEKAAELYSKVRRSNFGNYLNFESCSKIHKLN